MPPCWGRRGGGGGVEAAGVGGGGGGEELRASLDLGLLMGDRDLTLRGGEEEERD